MSKIIVKLLLLDILSFVVWCSVFWDNCVHIMNPFTIKLLQLYLYWRALRYCFIFPHPHYVSAQLGNLQHCNSSVSSQCSFVWILSPFMITETLSLSPHTSWQCASTMSTHCLPTFILCIHIMHTAHSTESALECKMTSSVNLIKKGSHTVLLDLSAAFDTIDHDHLFELLQNRFGIKGTALDWIKSYLGNWSSSVQINSKTSPPTVTSYGVPQGSVLGPIIFTIYTTPLANIIKHHKLSYHFYADDTQLYITFDPKSQCSLHESIARVEKCAMDINIWMSKKMLQLNDDKTEVLYISSPYFQKSLPNSTLKIDQSSITPTTSARNIGVIFDNCDQMREHITSVCRASHFHVGNIGSIRRYLTPETCATLVHSLISSEVDYCNSLLIKLPETQINRLQRIQNFAAHIVSRRPRHEHITPVLVFLYWESAPAPCSTKDYVQSCAICF